VPDENVIAPWLLFDYWNGYHNLISLLISGLKPITKQKTCSITKEATPPDFCLDYQFSNADSICGN